MSVSWYRVVDPQSPLFGCDVKGWISEAAIGADDALVIQAMRRIDMVVGDRPYQMIASDGENLGLAIRTDQLEVSAVQDDLIEMTRTHPYGEIISEKKLGDEISLTLVLYGRALQAAYVDGSIVVAKNTWLSSDLQELTDLADYLEAMFKDASSFTLIDFIKSGAFEYGKA